MNLKLNHYVLASTKILIITGTLTLSVTNFKMYFI